MDLSGYYDQAFAPYAQAPLTLDFVDRVERESKGLLRLVEEAKTRFLGERSWSGLRVAEMGAGWGGVGMSLARLGAEVTLVDFSPNALSVARSIFQREGLAVETLCLDVGLPERELQGQYDVIIDSHLLHCLPLEPQRLSYLELVRSHLTLEGIFVGETMVHRKKIFIPPGYMLDQNNVLWQMFAQWVPVRKIIDSMELEVEFKQAGFNIPFFYYYAQCALAPSADFWELPADILPASVRFTLKKT